MIGVDIVDLSRLDIHNEALMRRMLTEEERAEFAERRAECRKKEYAGGRFACKEAIFKATGDSSFLNYSILTGEKGKPYVKDHPEIEVTISHDGGLAIAMVLVQNQCSETSKK